MIPRRFALYIAAALAIAFAFVSARPSDAANAVSNIQMTTGSPAALEFNTNVDITFDYLTDDAGGVRVFFRPFTTGSLSGSYAAHGSGLYPVGAGSGTGFFTISSGTKTVDQVRVQMYNSDQSTLLLEFFVSVTYYFGPSGTITNIVLAPDTPATLAINDNVDIGFAYSTADAGGVRVFYRPFSGGSLSGSYAAHGSPLYPTGSGSGTGFFTISSGSKVVDQIRVQMYNAAQSVMYIEFFIPVSYSFQDPAPVEPISWGRLKATVGR